MLAAAHIEVDITPVFIGFFRYKGLVVVGVHVAEIISRRTGKTGHCVEFERIAFGGTPVFGASERRLSGLSRQILVYLGQFKRQLVVGCRNAVDIAHGDRFAPVALTAEDGIAEAIVYLYATYGMEHKGHHHQGSAGLLPPP